MTERIKVTAPTLALDVEPLDSASFAPFGVVTQNPRPGLLPTALASIASHGLPRDPIVVNQGHAIRYPDAAPLVDLYASAPSRAPSRGFISLFACVPRTGDRCGLPELERHPFTTQTFTPLGPRPGSRYLVVVAPSLPPSESDAGFAVPSSESASDAHPGRGLPDLPRLKAFVARGDQAITYNPGTWHAPMMTLADRQDDPRGPAPPITSDFLVIQFTNGVVDEDCQWADLEGGVVEATSLDHLVGDREVSDL